MLRLIKAKTSWLTAITRRKCSFFRERESIPTVSRSAQWLDGGQTCPSRLRGLAATGSPENHKPRMTVAPRANVAANQPLWIERLVVTGVRRARANGGQPDLRVPTWHGKHRAKDSILLELSDNTA
ncbi:MAG TPA: hypothetical protein VJ828_06725, partial [Lacipirellulaceae bacterium]|nr:hypothetical protein [Lacipirellulaceae bacterium]